MSIPENRALRLFFLQVRMSIHALDEWDAMTTHLRWKKEEEDIRNRYIRRIEYSLCHEPWRSRRWGMPPEIEVVVDR